MVVAHQRAGQEPRLGQDLEAVAGADDGPAAVRERLDRAHDRREARDRAGAQVVAVCESAGQDDRIGGPEIGLGVPDQPCLPAEDGVGDVREVTLAPRARERPRRSPAVAGR